MNFNFSFGFLFILLVSASRSGGFPREMEYCSLLEKCGINILIEDCYDSLRTGIKGVDYDSLRCSEARRLHGLGVPTDSYQGQKLFGFLGQKYRVDYEVVSRLPIKPSRFDYLLEDIPLAAKIVNAFQGSKYSVEYLDGDRRRYWRGDNGKNLYGEANLIAGGIQERHLVYFGFGIVKILKWKLKGQVLFEYAYNTPESESIDYDLKVVVFPGGAFINAIMNMGLFKKVVTNKILEVFQDITQSANELTKIPFGELMKKYDWTEEDKKKLQFLLTL